MVGTAAVCGVGTTVCSLPFLFQLIKTETPMQSWCRQEHTVPSHVSSQREGLSFMGQAGQGGRTLVFLILDQLPIAEATNYLLLKLSSEGMKMRKGISFFCPGSTCGMVPLSWAWCCWEYWSPVALTTACKAVAPCCKKQAIKN